MLQILLASPYHCYYVGNFVALKKTLFNKVNLNTVYLDIVFLNTIFLNTVCSQSGSSVLCWVQEERGGATRHLQLGACKEEHAETKPRSHTKTTTLMFLLHTRLLPKWHLGGILLSPVRIRLRCNSLNGSPKSQFCRKITRSGSRWPSNITYLVGAVDWLSASKPQGMKVKVGWSE